MPTEPELRDAEEAPERDEAVAPERLTPVEPERLTAVVPRLADVALDADEARLADEVRTEEPLREALDAEERVRGAVRDVTLRERVDEPERTARLPSRCPSWAAREGSQR